MNSSKYIFFFLLLIIISRSVVAQDWENSKDNNGVEAYTMVREKGLKEVKVVAEIDAPVRKLVKFITDYNNPKEWKHSTRSSKIVERESDSLFTVYFVIATPWPLRDRDFYATVEVKEDSVKNVTEIIYQPNTKIKDKSNKVRMTNFETKWILNEIEPNKTKIELYSFGDPVGIPSSLVNMFIVDTPFKTVQNLKKDIVTYQ